MTRADAIALLPLLVTGYGAAALMLVAAFRPRHWAVFALTMLILAASLVCLVPAMRYAPRTVSAFLVVDTCSVFFTGLVLVGAILVALLCFDYLASRRPPPAPPSQGEEPAGSFYVLLLLAVLGTEAVVSSVHFVSFFLGLEILSVSLYGLIGYTRGHRLSLEGAVKYLVLAATSSAFLLFGAALVYAETGSMAFEGIPWSDLTLVSFLGLALAVVAFGFKLAIVPFHMWSPDVYQGAPAVVTALIATGSKGGVFALLLRLVLAGNLASNPTFFLTITVLSIATMTAGNLLALMQTNVKRLLAYSSIAHIGYLLIPLLAGGTRGPSSIAFYFASYFATTVAAFGVIAVVSASRAMGDLEELRHYHGLASRRPYLAAVLGIALLSLTGIPPTAGFIAKFYIFSAAADAGLWTLLIAGIVNSGIAAFYYLRVLAAMFAPPEKESEPPPGARPLSAISLALCSAVVVVFGVYPAPLVRLAEVAMRACR